MPVVLPRLAATVDPAGRLTVALDGAPLTAAPIGRAAFGNLIDEVLRKRRVPVRVEVIEQDGTSYTDVLTPPPPPVPETPDDRTRPSATATEVGAVPQLVEVTGEGFVPGEDVAVAVILRHSSATPSGHVRHLLENRELPAGGEVLLFGRISGTSVVIGGRG